MNHRLQRRIVSLVAAVAFFATGAVDAYGLHSCPHHDALPASAHGDAGGQTDLHTGHDGGHGLHSAPAAAVVHGEVAAADLPHTSPGTSAVPSDGGAQDDHGPCSCAGECSLTAPPAPGGAPHITISAPPTAAPAPQRTATQPRARTTPHVLPYANAPPHC